MSTTHVSVSAILGSGLVAGQARWKKMVVAWVTTLLAGLALSVAA
jgi:phosphate/sulfate permease